MKKRFACFGGCGSGLRPKVEEREDGEFTPAILFLVNPLSGAGSGERILLEVEKKPCPFMGSWKAMSILEFAKDAERKDAAMKELEDWIAAYPHGRIVVGGGDGTVKWALEILSQSERIQSPFPPIAHMPLGTGNEFSRASGWGINNVWGVKRLKEYCELINRGPIYGLDVWDLDVHVEQGILERKESAEEEERLTGESHKLVGFFTFGFDADITVDFHNHRTKMLKERGKTPDNVYLSRILYIGYGIKRLLRRGKNIEECFEISVDGDKIKLPRGTQGLYFHNIHCSCGGTYFWSNQRSSSKDSIKSFQPLATDDGLLEVSCVRSITHTSLIRIKTTHARRLAQGKEVTIRILKRVASQLDGEPRINEPGTIIRISQNGNRGRLIGGPGHALNMKPIDYKSEIQERINQLHHNVESLAKSDDSSVDNHATHEA